MHKTVNADEKRFLTNAHCARNINNKQNIENVFNSRRSEQCIASAEIDIFFYCSLFAQRTQNEMRNANQSTVWNNGRHCANMITTHISPIFMRFEGNRKRWSEKKAISIQNKTQIDKHCCRNCVWVLGKCEWLVFLFLYSSLFFLCFLYFHPMSVCSVHHSECTGILPFIMRTQTSKNVSLLLHGINKKEKTKFFLRSLLLLPLPLPLFQNPFFYKYNIVHNRFQLFVQFLLLLPILFRISWSFVKRASMTTTWMRVFLLILFRIKIQWTFIHTFLFGCVSVSVCVCVRVVLKSKLNFHSFTKCTRMII